MFSKFKKELLIAGLLLSTVTLIFANQVFERSYELTTGNHGMIRGSADTQSGDSSQASVEVEDEAFKLSYAIDHEVFANAYSAMGIYPDENFERDLSWVERIELKIKSSKPQSEEILFQVRTFLPNTTVAEDNVSFKYNEVLLSVSDKMETVVVNRDDFTVPSWWKQRYDVRGDDGDVSFRDIEFFEININNRTEQGVVDVASIRCIGNWVNVAALNQFLLWTWMGGALVGLVFRMLTLKKRLTAETASTSTLLAHNSQLASESATYQDLARRDPLTGLLNRYGLEGALNERSSNNHLNYTMVLFDLDEFKEINDNLGHCHGDRVLFDIARIAKSKMNDKDMAARWGGDEFLLILKHHDLKQAVELAEEIRQAITLSEFNYSCSFGVSRIEKDSDFESTLRNADAALYESKDGGRNKISVYKGQNIDRRRNPSNRRSSDEAQIPTLNTSEDVPPITLPQVETPTGGFMIYE